jgi:multidrug efflux pump subunit AcrA (membrane-fusion protein)
MIHKMKNVFNKVFYLPQWFRGLSIMVKIILILALAGAGWALFSNVNGRKNEQPQYQTALAEKGTLVIAVTGSGQVSTANSASVTTRATGVVSEIYVQDGDMVKAGDAIAKVDPDMVGRQNESQALASYQSAKNNLDSARTGLYSLQKN